MSDYIKKEVLRDLLKTNDRNLVLKRESNTIEFKESFDWKLKQSRAKYLHSIAAYANKKGGYMFFGVKNKPRELVGIGGDFDDLDDADISSYFNTYLSPSIEFERTSIKIKGKNLGVIYIHESKHKPIVCVKSYDQILSESTIYYRYNSQSDRIKSGDLIALLNEVRERESQRWINLFQNISKIGIDNARIFDLKEGEISTISGGKFIIDEKLLSRLKVLDSYSSKEKDGAPAVRIIGDIDTKGTIITKSTYLYDGEIIQDFLQQKEINNGEEYLKAICHQNSGMLPVYFYIKQAGLKIKDATEIIKNVNKHSQAKSKLLSRLANDSTLLNSHSSCNVYADTAIGNQRLNYYNNILKRVDIVVPDVERQIKSLLEAVINLKEGEFETPYLLPLLDKIATTYYGNKNLVTTIRQAVAYVDLMTCKDDCL